MDASVAAKRGARFVPESVVGRAAFGIEPGGGIRGLAAGLRYVALPGGAVETAGSFLPSRGASGDEKAALLPDRLHGGFVFLGGRTLFRAETWLGDARAVLDAPTDVTQVTAGLDRLYIGYGRSEVGAVDPLTFAPVPFGRMPDAPSFVGYAAFDGWHAAAIADLRGLVLTRDAGATWQTVAVPLVPAEVHAREDGFVVRGRDAAGTERAVEVDVDGHVTPAASSSPDAPPAISARMLADLAGTGPFGARPLVAAVEDGWPLEDGSALVLRGGLFARIGLERGEVLETFPATVAAGAPPGEGARCHPLDLGPGQVPGATEAAVGRLGFVCGLEGADTWLYTFDAAHGQLATFGHFSGPRAVLAPGNGRIAVHGSCDEHAPHASDVYCLSGKTLGDWRELRLEGALDGERVVPLGRGGIAVLSPAHGDLARMRLTVRGADGRDPRAVSTCALHVHAENAQAGAPLAAGVATLLRDGVWLDGVRETSPGVLDAWVDGHGSVLGLSITLDGDATHGDWVRDLSSPFVSGRFGLGMSAARRGYQTVDGGRHWSLLDTPAPLTLPGSVERRACGPVGCFALGWLRIGWGDRRDAPKVPDDPRVPSLVGATRTNRPPPSSTPNLGCHLVGHAEKVEPSAPKLPAFDDWSPFLGLAAPRPPAGTHGGAFAVHAQLGGQIAAKVYVWGPPTPVDALDAANALALPPELQPRFVVRWISPFGGATEARSSAIAPAPASIGALTDPSARGGFAGNFTLMAGEGPDEALLVRSSAGITEVFELVAGRPPLAWRTESSPWSPSPPPSLASGPLASLSLPPILAAVHAAGHWYVASSSPAGEPGPPRTALWKVEHGVARKLAEVPRFVPEGHHPEVHLARREDGRAVALLVGTDPRQANDADNTAWVLPFDLESGVLGQPQSLGTVDVAEGSALTPCGAPGGSPGWVVDTSLGLRPRILTRTEPVVLSSPTARVHLRATDLGEGSRIPQAQTSGGSVVCLEHLAGSLGELVQPAFPMTHPVTATEPVPREFSLVAETPHERQSLSCRTLR